MNKKVILAVGAHPDDIEFGCGGTLKLHKNVENQVYALLLTDGECNQEQRIRESTEAAKILCLDELFFAHLPVEELSDNRRNVHVIEKYINELNPDIIFTPSKNDNHQDHRYCALATFSATRHVPNILIYESFSTISFNPHIYVDISKTMGDKMEALKRHKSQIIKGSIQLDDVQAFAKYRASHIKKISRSVEYAEAFEVNHILSYPKTGGMEL